jgi:uncharacterized membrane protein YphA (DoxX/SURF4 family)
VTFGLLWLPQARFIAEDAATNTALSPLGSFYRDVVLPNWGFFGAFLTVAEIAAGLALLLGVLTRAAAAGTLALITPIRVLYLVSDATQYLWTYPVDLVPLLLLAIVPAGRTAALDGRLAARFGDRWPFLARGDPVRSYGCTTSDPGSGRGLRATTPARLRGSISSSRKAWNRRDRTVGSSSGHVVQNASS